MAKAWYDNQVPTMEMGLLSGMPDMSLTAEDKKRALLQALMQGGLGMAAASLGGANTSQAMGRGLLGGADAYGQGLQAPMSRFEMAKKQLEFQGNQLNNAKLLNDYKQGQQQADIFRGAAQGATNGAFDQLGQVNNAYLQNGPQQQPLDNAGSFDQLYAQSLSKNLQSPDTLARFGAAGGDISKLTSYMNAMKPDTIAGGSWQRSPLNGQMTYVPKIADNAMVMPDGSMSEMPGSVDTLAKLAGAGEAAKAKYDLVQVPQSNGSVRMMSRADFLKMQQPQQQNSAAPSAQNGNKFAGARMVNGRVVMPSRAEQGMAAAVSDLGPNPDMPEMTQTRAQLGISQSPTEQAVQTANAMLSPEAQKIATSEGLKASIDRIGKSKDLAKTSIDSALALQQAMDAVKSGAYQGRFADWQTAGAAVMSALPGLNEMIDPKKLANSQTAGAHLSEQILGKIKTLGANPSNADREYITKTVAQLTNDPAAFRRLTNYMQSMTMRGIENHNADASRIHSVKGLDPSLTGTDYRVNAPAQLVEARQKVMTVFKNGTPEQKKHLRALGYVE